MISYQKFFFFILTWHRFITSLNGQTCSSTASGDISTYTVTQNSCSGGVDCIDDYDCDITCSGYACGIDIYGPNTGYDLSVDCNNDFACQRVVINANNDNSNGDIYAVFDASYTGDGGSMYTTSSGTITLDCVGNRGCAHFSMYISQSSSNDGFVNIDITCQPSSSGNSHICYDFSIDGTNYYKGNLKMLCDATNGCQNSNIGSPMFGSVEIICSESFSCAGSNLGVILNNDDINNEVINNYVDGYGTFECSGSFSCQSSVLYCPNYKDCSILCDGTSACDGVSIYCPKYGGNCELDCSNGCNNVMLYTYNDNYDILNDDSSVTVSNTVIDLDDIDITESGTTGGGTANTGTDSNTDSNSGSNSSNNSNNSSGGDGGDDAVVTVLVVLIILIVVGAAGFVGYRMYTSKQNSQSKTTSSNSSGVNTTNESGMAMHLNTQAKQQHIAPAPDSGVVTANANSRGERPSRPPPPRPKTLGGRPTGPPPVPTNY